MSERHVVLRVGRGDNYAPKSASRSTVFFTLHGGGENPEAEIKEKHVWSRRRSASESGLYDLGLTPSQTALDLYRISVVAYCADLRLPRRRYGYDDWTRDIVLHVPVADMDLWLPQAETLTELLSFLSGDRWRIEFRQQEVPAPEPQRRRKDDKEEGEPDTFDAVCLFSGGLDSFIGAADAVGDGRNLLLVSHIAEGTWRWISAAQDVLREGLKSEHEDRRIEHVKVTLNPPRPTESTGRERTQRARSILFLGLGMLAAAATDDSIPLIVPENGFISLNLPLTPGRIGSLSTRTTHPNTISLYRKVLDGLGIEVPIELPYMFMTKGEMLAGAKACEVVRNLAGETVSCASPNPWGPDEEKHCGYCVPCIIRRAAMRAAGLDNPNRYRLDILHPEKELTDRQATHLKGFRLAVRNRAGGVTPHQLLSAGPLPASEGSIDEFTSIHDRGLAEVAAFLSSTS